VALSMAAVKRRAARYCANSHAYIGQWCQRLTHAAATLYRQTAVDALREVRTHAIEAKPQHLLRLLDTIEHAYGHRISGQTQKPIRQDNKPLPWFTYPAIDYLEQIDLSSWRVFEYASGYGSKYFAARCASVESVENDPRWYESMLADKPANLSIYLCNAEEEYVSAIGKSAENYDLVIVDGLWRPRCARAALNHLTPNGMVILDNSDRYANTAAYLREAGLLQVDFSGFGPVNYYTWTTSVFFRRSFRGVPIGRVQPIPAKGSLPLVADAPEPAPREVDFDARAEPTSVNSNVSAKPSAGPRQPGVWSYAQEGEDILLRRFLADRKKGFYVDIGAHHPISFSNTYAFYCLGWRGINVDAQPGSMKLFAEFRPDDINVERAVSSTRTKLIYFQFAEPALNTFSRDLALTYDTNGHPIMATSEISTVTLSDILDEYLPPGSEIDFLTVDVEGLDLEVLQSNNWEEYRPRMVLVEDLQLRNLENARESATFVYLQERGYRLAAKTFNTMFFGRN